MTTPSNKPAVWFWIVAVISLLWNIGGVMAFMMQAMMTPATLAAMPEAERNMYNIPMFITVAFAIGSFGSLLGSILLLIRKKVATPVFIVALAAILIQMGYTLFASEMLKVRGAAAAGLPVTIVVIGIFLVWFSRRAESAGWLK